MDDYSTLRTYESDYDKAQAEFRRAAALWILAILSAFAYLIVPHAEPYASDHSLNIAASAMILSLLGAMGLFILWWIDQYTYQRLLHSIFVYGLYIEWRNKNEGFLRPRSILFSRNLNISRKLSLFYIVPMGLFLLIDIIAVSIRFSGIDLDGLQISSIARVVWDYPIFGYRFVYMILFAINIIIFSVTFYIALKETGGKSLVNQYCEGYPEEFLFYMQDRHKVAKTAIRI